MYGVESPHQYADFKKYVNIFCRVCHSMWEPVCYIRKYYSIWMDKNQYQLIEKMKEKSEIRRHIILSCVLERHISPQCIYQRCQIRSQQWIYQSSKIGWSICPRIYGTKVSEYEQAGCGGVLISAVKLVCLSSSSAPVFLCNTSIYSFLVAEWQTLRKVI